MIPTPRGWTRTFLDAPDDALVMSPPGGAAIGLVGYRERVRPIADLRTLIDRTLADFKDFVVSAERSAPLVTLEGEYAALVTLDGTIAGAPAQRDLGFVFGDDFYAIVSGLVHDAAQFATFTDTVRDLTSRDSHRMGVRRRRFLYAPPPNWVHKPRGFVARWRPPGATDDSTVLTVWPANPRFPGEDAASLLDAKIAEDEATGFVLDHRSAAGPLTSLHGLVGTSWEIIGRYGATRVFRDLVVFEDVRYLYVIQLETIDPTHRVAAREVLLALVGSALPLPAPHADSAPTHTFDHWVL